MHRRTETTQERGARIDLLDYGRMFAALAVACFHYFASGPRSGQTGSITGYQGVDFFYYGYLGVHFFFLLSGFVVLRSAHGRTAREYAGARALRLFPAYLFCLTITALVLAVFPSPMMPVSLDQYVLNLTMVPRWLGGKYIDGAHWTLGYEMAFYAVLYGVLLWGQLRRVEAILLGWLALCFVAKLIGADVLIFGRYYSLFLGGCLLYLISRDGWSWQRALGLSVSAALSVSDTLAHAFKDGGGMYEAHLSLPVVVSVVLAFYLIIYVASLPAAMRLRLPGAAWAGAISYPFYLLHAYVGFRAIDAFATEANKGTITALTLVGVAVMASIVVVFVERPFRQFLRQRSIQRQAIPQ